MTSNLNLEIANLALNINQTTKEEIGQMITEECEDKYALNEHTHTKEEITDLEDLDNTYAAKTHTHTMAEITDLEDLDETYALKDHTHQSLVMTEDDNMTMISPSIIAIGRDGGDSGIQLNSNGDVMIVDTVVYINGDF